MDPFIARQPIFDRHRHVYGYELLFRAGQENCFTPGTDGDTATSSLISDTVGIHGFSELTSGKKAFVNVTESVLLNETYTILPPESTVIELLETVEMTDSVHRACKEVRKQGYLLALDDYIGDPSFDRILDEIDILKIDFGGTDPEQRRKIAVNFEGKNTRVLAEKIETHEEFQEALELGFEYMQGYFFCKPEMIKGATLPGFKLNCLQFLQEINQPSLDLDGLEQIIIRDVSLSYQLLKTLNSASAGVRHKINSVKHAMVMLGDVQLRKWASLIAMKNLGADKPHELMMTSMIRGKFCESLGHLSRMSGQELNLFLLGLFSVLDAMLDQPMNKALHQLPLHTDVIETLSGETTVLSPVYQLAVAFERGEWLRIGGFGEEVGIEEDLLAKMYIDAVTWAQSVLGSQGNSSMKKAS